tara:strand:- start:44 stop:652 length:609 start_codon:yes stop_codon:yes gene_type:complete
MNLKLILQVILILSIIIILTIFYYSFFSIEKKNSSNNFNDTSESDIIIKKNVLNELVNIEFNSTDEDGNSFYINAERATTILDEQDQNKVNLEGVVAIIDLNNKGIINIFSKNAIYDKLNHNTLFFNKVRAEYLNNQIFAGNLDVIFTEKFSKIYNNVIYNDNNNNLSTDEIIINMLTGDIKLKMKNKSKKVKLKTNYEFFN